FFFRGIPVDQRSRHLFPLVCVQAVIANTITVNFIFANELEAAVFEYELLPREETLLLWAAGVSVELPPGFWARAAMTIKKTKEEKNAANRQNLLLEKGLSPMRGRRIFVGCLPL